MMRIGVSLASAHRVSDPREGARWMITRAKTAWDAGLDSLFVGDHHVTPAPYYQNVAILGRLLAEWGERPAGALFLLPLWQPVLLAEQVATLAAIARGPFVLQCALGGGDEQFAGMGVPPGQRPSRFEQSLAILRKLWAGETVSHDGR
jgi:alkanesulfonate monooxygenase SsuD/methylene tetrahydromethanopterin reductase-like flavin-dependent oxidoreductase (luciferase family)